MSTKVVNAGEVADEVSAAAFVNVAEIVDASDLAEVVNAAEVAEVSAAEVLNGDEVVEIENAADSVEPRDHLLSVIRRQAQDKPTPWRRKKTFSAALAPRQDPWRLWRPRRQWTGSRIHLFSRQ